MQSYSFVVVLLANLAANEPAVKIETPMAPPGWALAQRALLHEATEACVEFEAKYVDERGYVKCVERWGGNDGPDDGMENFRNWTLLYSLGAPDKLLALYRKVWEGHIEQYTEARIPTIPMVKDGMYYREFVTAFDWEQNGEGLSAFLFYGLSEPTDRRYLARVKRFSSFYMNEDAEALNYDPKHKIIRSLHNGSRGPKLSPATPEDCGGLPVEGDPQRLTRYSTASNIRGDHPLNLCACSLPMTAYLLTGEPRYRDWLLEYAGAWRDRVLENGGNIPTNIGLDGTIGGEWDGKWYGGVFGWNFWPQSSGRNYYVRGPRIAFGECILLTGDVSYAEPLRQQIENLYAASKIIDGKRMFPNKHGDDGWYGYGTSARTDVQLDIYLWSMDPHDKRRLGDHGWIKFLNGDNPDYPLQAVQKDLSAVRTKVEGMRNDPTTPETRGSDEGHKYNPAQVTSLVNLMLGGNHPGGAGNVLHSRVRYFDPKARRSGLPSQMGALVDRIEDDSISLTLVNLDQRKSRSVIVLMGAYAEHHCELVELDGVTTPVDATHFTVDLAPGAGARLKIRQQRYAHQPTLSLPWDRSWMLGE